MTPKREKTHIDQILLLLHIQKGSQIQKEGKNLQREVANRKENKNKEVTEGDLIYFAIVIISHFFNFSLKQIIL